MISKKILAWALFLILVFAWIWVTFADNTNTGTISNWTTNYWFFKNIKWSSWLKYSWKWFYNRLTQDEKIKLSSMTIDEKKAFFETKKQERLYEIQTNIENRKKKDEVIDILLAWWKLTAEQEQLKLEIINERTLIKTERLTREKQLSEFKKILEKKKNWETLSNEEQTLYNNHKHNKKERGFWKRNK